MQGITGEGVIVGIVDDGQLDFCRYDPTMSKVICSSPKCNW